MEELPSVKYEQCVDYHACLLTEPTITDECRCRECTSECLCNKCDIDRYY